MITIRCNDAARRIRMSDRISRRPGDLPIVASMTGGPYYVYMCCGLSVEYGMALHDFVADRMEHTYEMALAVAKSMPYDKGHLWLGAAPGRQVIL